ncbi:hypothetical protein J1G44_18310 [Cellulomonas sp. zg-ZUI199]|uniref:DUF222 domain-containing protein n=1 Tax=Cellulomonas wangleii TaxID=2816956 RepID=A0ABX8D8X6_9CELL|nr:MULTISPECIES: hypothetical protein [Cellulomonas]MBO0900465.1 hypothetical protein [Cellulomonas sp. zg-ZUI22]MBO0926430.1 hypothetical protein [Cellulomonas wangleii]QVI63898.1 hypothetical protein KG103_08805 [Cellulomonas wangleii]
MTQPDATRIDLTLVRTYLNDHITGASAVASRVQRMSRNPDAGQDAADLERLATELREERRVHEATARDLGFRLSRWKHLGAALAERVARLKPNGRAVGRSPMTIVLELEVLRSGLEGKRLGWTTLREHAVALDLDAERLDALVARSREQAELVEAMHARHRAQAFDAPAAHEGRAAGGRG